MVKNLKNFLLDKMSEKEFQADSEFYTLFGKNQEALRKLLGSRFDDWLYLCTALHDVCLIFPKVRGEELQTDKIILTVVFGECCIFRQDFLSLTMKIIDIEPWLAHHIFTMISQVIIEYNLVSSMHHVMKLTTNSSVSILVGANQFVARKDVWKYLVQLFSYVVSCTPVPKLFISPLMHSSKKLLFFIIPLEMSLNSDIRNKRRMKLLCLLGTMRVLMKYFFGFNVDRRLPHVAIRKFFKENQRRHLLK